MMKLRFLPLILAVIFTVGGGLAMSPAFSAEKQDITVKDAWSRERPSGAVVGGAFLTIQNTANHPDRLISASTPIADRAEVHESVMKDGVMGMLHRDEIIIVSGETVILKPGSFHVMLMGLKEDLTKGKTFPLTLTFARAGDITVTVHVEDAGAMKSTK